MSVGPSELIVILIVVLLLFGSRRIAALGKGIGEGIRGFKRGIAGEDDEPSPPPAVKSEPLTGGTTDAAAQGSNTGPQADTKADEPQSASPSEDQSPKR